MVPGVAAVEHLLQHVAVGAGRLRRPPLEGRQAGADAAALELEVRGVESGRVQGRQVGSGDVRLAQGQRDPRRRGEPARRLGRAPRGPIPPALPGLAEAAGAEGRPRRRVDRRPDHVPVAHAHREALQLGQQLGHRLAPQGVDDDDPIEEDERICRLRLVGKAGLERGEGAVEIAGELLGPAEEAPHAEERCPVAHPPGEGQAVPAELDRGRQVDLEQGPRPVVDRPHHGEAEAVRPGQPLADLDHPEAFLQSPEEGERGAAGDERIGEDAPQVGVLGGLEDALDDLEGAPMLVVQEERPAEL